MDSKHKPLHYRNCSGQYFMSVPHYGFYDIKIPSPQYYKIKRYKRINRFVLFRTLIQNTFSKNVGYSSRKAGKIWGAADEDFKEIFTNIARELEIEREIKFKNFQVERKSKPKKNNIKLSKSFTKPIKREALVGDLFQNDVNCFAFAS
jgi:hypothetical protein